MVSIVVQPPSQTSVDTQFYPPLVARTRVAPSAADDGYSYLFAMAVLLDHNGDALEGQLQGTGTLSSGVSLMDYNGSRGGGSSSSGQPSVYFTFPDLFVLYAGTYSVRVDVYVVDYEDPQGAQLVQQTESRSITVHEDDVAVERACKAARIIGNCSMLTGSQPPTRGGYCATFGTKVARSRARQAKAVPLAVFGRGGGSEGTLPARDVRRRAVERTMRLAPCYEIRYQCTRLLEFAPNRTSPRHWPGTVPS